MAVDKHLPKNVKANFPSVALPRSAFFSTKFVPGMSREPLSEKLPERDELVQMLRRFDLLSKPPLKILRGIASVATVRLYRKGEFLWRRDDEVSNIALICSGFAKTARRNRNGDSQTYGLYGPGDTLGLFTIFSPEMRHPLDAVALNMGLKVICISTTTILKFAEISPLFLSNLLYQSTLFSEDLIKKIEILNAGSISRRLAVLLLQLFDRYGHACKDGGGYLPILLPLEQLSEIIDAKLETMSRVLGKWKSANWLRVDAKGYHFNSLDKIRELLID